MFINPIVHHHQPVIQTSIDHPLTCQATVKFGCHPWQDKLALLNAKSSSSNDKLMVGYNF